jgi:hypothetical protein
MLVHSDPATARQLLKEAEADVVARWRLYEHWATMPARGPNGGPNGGPTDGSVAVPAGEAKQGEGSRD